MRMLLPSLFFIFLFTGISAAQQPPLVDGDCGEYAGLKAARFMVSKDVELHIYQDRHFVWLCYDYPDGSFGTADLRLVTSAFPAGINLHVSAQLGEWPMDKPDLAPKNPESDLWWNHKGWTANMVWINGMDRTGERARPRYKNAKAREIQIGKSRFGRGRWKVSLEIRSIKASDERLYDVRFPTSGEHQLKVK